MAARRRPAAGKQTGKKGKGEISSSSDFMPKVADTSSMHRRALFSYTMEAERCAAHLCYDGEMRQYEKDTSCHCLEGSCYCGMDDDGLPAIREPQEPACTRVKPCRYARLSFVPAGTAEDAYLCRLPESPAEETCYEVILEFGPKDCFGYELGEIERSFGYDVASAEPGDQIYDGVIGFIMKHGDYDIRTDISKKAASYHDALCKKIEAGKRVVGAIVETEEQKPNPHVAAKKGKGVRRR